MPRTVAIVQARMDSTRLPGKSLMTLGGRPLIVSVLERVLACQGVDQVVAALPDTRTNDPLAVVCEAAGVEVIRGPHEDVLSRYVLAADKTQADVIVRVTGDCPLWDPGLGARAVAYQRRTGWAYVGDCRLPGLDVEVFTRDALGLADAWLAGSVREHVVAKLVPAHWPTSWAPKPWWPWLAVDTADDLARVRAVHARLDVGRRADERHDGMTWRATWWAWRAAGRP